MTATEGFLSALKDRNIESKRTRKGWSAKCPAHDDQRASLSIAKGEGGRALVNCHAGCTAEAVCNAVGLRPADLMPDDRSTPSSTAPDEGTSAVEKPSRKQNGKSFTTPEKAIASLERQFGKPSASWTYRDTEGKPVGQIVRWDKPDGAKEFRPITRHPDGWRISGMPEPRPLYGLSELAAAEAIYIVEGEKTADAVRSIGLVATTSPHGSNSAAKADWSILAGKKCVIFPDYDDAGRAYANDVAAILAKLTPAATVKVVQLTELPDGSPMPKGGDLADWVDAHGDAAEP